MTIDERPEEQRGGELGLVELSLGDVGGGQKSQADLVKALQRNGVLRTAELAQALAETDRALFIPLEHGAAIYAEPYENAPVTIDAFSKSTLSTPHHHAMVGELCARQLERHRGGPCNVLDLGCGTGYLAVVLARAARRLGCGAVQVATADAVPRLVTAANVIRETKVDAETQCCLLPTELAFAPADDEAEQLSFLDRCLAQGRAFDLIHAGFALPCQGEYVQVLTGPLLRAGGRLVCALRGENGSQELVYITKSASGELVKHIVMAPVHCQAMFDSLFDEREAAMTAEERLARAKERLDRWTADFEAANGRKPSKAELIACDHFSAFAQLRRRVWDK